MKEHLFFVGPGRMGLALGYALWQTDGVGSLTYCGRRPDPPSHPLFIQGSARYVFGLERPVPETTALILSVPDQALQEMAVSMARQGPAPSSCAAFHLSGSLTAEVLTPLHAQGYSVGTLHPLQAVAHPLTGADFLPGSYFAVTGEPEATATARRLLGYLGSPSLQIPVTLRPLYHAAAVLASNSIAAIVAAAARVAGQAGISEEEALDAFLPLARGTLRNLEKLGPEHGMTGPVSRGDTETVRLHLKSLDPRERRVYAVLGSEILNLTRQFLDEEVAEELADLLEDSE